MGNCFGFSSGSFLMLRFAILVVFIFASVFLSGCVPDTSNDDKTKIVSKDLLKIVDKDGFYATSEDVGTGQTFRIYMNIENVGNSEVKLFVGESEKGIVKDDPSFVQHGKSILYNYNSQYKIIKRVGITPWKYELYETYAGSGKFYDMAIVPPRGNVGLGWTIKAPEDKDFTQLTNEGIFEFHLKYIAEAETFREISFQNIIDSNQDMFTDSKIKVHENNIAAPGPVVIDFKVPGGEPVEVDNSDSSDSFDITLFFRNVGKGLVIMEEGSVELRTPKGLGIGDSGCDFVFKGTETDDNGILRDVYISKTYIEFYGDQGDEVMFCSFKKPSVEFLDVHQFSARADYIYTTEPRTIEIITRKKEARR